MLVQKTKPPKLRNAILRCLQEARGSAVTTDALVDYCYGDREDGGPDWASSTIKEAVFQLRKLGVRIGSLRGRGRSGYWLEGC